MPAFSSIISHAARKVNRTGKFVIKIYDFSRPFEEVRRALAFSGKVEYNCGMSDLHTHSAFSPDGVSPLEEMAARAHEQGLKYFGVSEHFDFDYAACGIWIDGGPMPLTDEEGYFSAARALQKEYAAKGMRLLAGGEYGFCPDKGCCERYLALTERQKPDFIINSVHTVDGADCYFPEYFEGKSREQAYGDYLERVRESLDAPYPYDIVAHIGYVGRKAPYPDRMLRYDDFPALFDDILKTIIQKGKILEVNSSTRGIGAPFLPDTGVLARYFELGGRRLSFGSDAHDISRIAEGRETAIAALKALGFAALTIPDCGEYKEILL